MSLPEADARVRLSTWPDSLELALVDSTFREVARGRGSLDATVRPGIYELRCRAGPVIEKRLVRLDPGALHEELNLRLEFPSAAPASGTSTSHEYHERAAVDASFAVISPEAARVHGGDAGLVIMLRNLRGSDDLAIDHGQLELVGSDFVPVPFFEDGWKLDLPSGYATWTGLLPAGGYALRTTRPDLAFDQSLWLTRGWKTLVFVPNTAAGAAPESASIHMGDLGTPWEPYDEHANIALELALWGLREGRSVAPPEDVTLLLNAKFKNPMVGIIGAHALLLEPELDFPRLDLVLGNLDGLVPEHPDVTALWRLVQEQADMRGLDHATPHPQTATTWPPMLAASFAALIRLDAHHPGAIARGSGAELVAPVLLDQGVWTTWRRAETLLRATSYHDDPAVRRVSSYLADVAELADGVPDRRSTEPAQISLATGLPTATVERVLAGITAEGGLGAATTS